MPKSKEKAAPAVAKKPRVKEPAASFGAPKPEVDDLARRRQRRNAEGNGQQAKAAEAILERVIDTRQAMPSEAAGKPAPPDRAAPFGPEFGQVPVRILDVYQLQTLFDLGRLSIPGVKPDDVCKVQITKQWKGQTIEVGCPHRAVLRQLEKTECEACHAHKSNTVVYLCLLHGIEHFGGGAPIKDMGPLFGADQPRRKAEPKAAHAYEDVLHSTCPNCLEHERGKSHFDGEVFSCVEAIV